MIRSLRRAERSRRKLLLYALLETVAKTPAGFGPLPPVEIVWELLARVEDTSAVALDRLLAHPYVGVWAGYTTRLLRDGLDGVGPLWVHLGHVHAIAAAAAIHAGLRFEILVPSLDGNVALPSLGLARLPVSSPRSVAHVGGEPGNYVVSHPDGCVCLPVRPDTDGAGWWAIRRVSVQAGKERFVVRLDDLDPYRGLYEPVSPQRLSAAEYEEWRDLLSEAWRLLVTAMPNYARLLPAGLDSLVPRPRVPFRNPSASTGEAFGSAVLGYPTDAASLAATLVHEVQHIVLGGLLHLTALYNNDTRERIYVPWRDDPRPLSGAVQGVYAFFGVVAFWRAIAAMGAGSMTRRAWFEFAYWRRQTWRTLEILRPDSCLTAAGRRFLDRMAALLGSWQHEPVGVDVADLAAAAATDHRAGWRLRHMRPNPDTVTGLTSAWLAGRPRPPVALLRADLPPTPVPDGPWSHARADLIRLALTETGHTQLPDVWPTVPGATLADVAYVMGRHDEAAEGYRTELVGAPDSPSSLVGLGLALAATGPNPAARALLHCPELVRAVHRELRRIDPDRPTPEAIGSWIGQLVSE
jgi:HEXXH motif-containing protein